MLSKNEIANALGLSCVEKYFLPWLEKNYDITALYGSSFVSLSQVFDDFAHGAAYENYGYLPRLQNTAEDYGIVSHRYIVCSAEEAINKIKNADKERLCLIRVNTEFFVNFKRASWREDHYVYVNGDMDWINEYPLSSGRFGKDGFAAVYDGAMCEYKKEDLSVVPPETATNGFISQTFDFTGLPASIGKLEAAVGILRVTRKRLEKFYKDKSGIADLLRAENLILDKLYFDLHISAVRNRLSDAEKTDYAKKLLSGCLDEIIASEKKIAEELKK